MIASISIFPGCSTESDTAQTENQVATVVRSDVTNEITAAGNLSLSLTDDLAFEMSGTVAEVLVDAGDMVEEGQLLVRLDTSAWEKELTSLQRAYLQAEISLKSAQLALSNAERGTATQEPNSSAVYYVIDTQEVNLKKLQLQIAEIAYENAEKDLNEAQEAGPEISAPFAGFVSQVLVSGGDEILKGTEAVQLADPNKFEVNILVSEMDIFDIEPGGQARVTVDTENELTLPAEITYISPTSTISSGVVNYAVTVAVGSLEDYLQEQQAVTPQSTPSDIELKGGMTVTVSLIVSSATDVLVVPNSAVLQRGMQTYVQVITADGTIEERAITTGISDWQYTEVIDGLSKGEQVVIPQGTSTTTATEEFQGPPGGMMVPEGGPPAGGMTGPPG